MSLRNQSSESIIGAILFGAANVLGFPFVFQAMFFAYAMLGTVVFILLDAPSLKPLSGAKAVGALIVFYVILCVVFIAGASLWPQYRSGRRKRQDQ